MVVTALNMVACTPAIGQTQWFRLFHILRKEEEEKRQKKKENYFDAKSSTLSRRQFHLSAGQLTFTANSEIDNARVKCD